MPCDLDASSEAVRPDLDAMLRGHCQYCGHLEWGNTRLQNHTVALEDLGQGYQGLEGEGVGYWGVSMSPKPER